MAAGARARKRSARARKRSPAAAGLSRGVLRAISACIRGIGHLLVFPVAWLIRRLERVDVSGRLRREVLAVSAVTLAVLVAFPLVGLTDERAHLDRVGDGIRALFGRGAVVVPLAFLWLAIEALFSQDEGARLRRGVGYGLCTISVVSFLHLIGGPSVQQAGGYFGSGFGQLAIMAAGNIGAGILLFTIGIIGVYFLTGADAVSIVQAWRQAHAARQVRREARSQADPEDGRDSQDPTQAGLEIDSSQRPVITLPRSSEQNRRSGTGSAAVEDSVGLDPDHTDGEVLPPPPLPDLTRLALYDGGLPDTEELEQKAELIQDTLSDFKVDARVREICPGPAVTLFTLQPGPGVKVRRITELQNDLALALAAPSIRIEAPVPGMARVGLEIPNASIHVVGLRETIESSAFQQSKAKIPLALGRDVNGESIIADLAKMPHLLIAGATGSGKSVCINGIIATFLITRRPDELQMVMIDPKMVELVGFNGVPHLKGPVVTEMDKVVGALRLVLREMERRYQMFSTLGVRNIDGYNLRRDDDPSLEALPYLVVVIDELADLMMTTPEEVESLLVRLAQMARATGIHLMIATQRPSVDVLTGLIKANVPARIAFAVTSQTDSRVVLDLPGAERLLGKGDMLFLPPDAAKPKRVQGTFIEDKDLQYLVRHWRRVVPNHTYDPEWVDLPSSGSGDEQGSEDPLRAQAIKIVQQHRTASVSMLQRKLQIGYNRAARIIEQLEDEGIVGPADGSRGRSVYIVEDEE